MRLLKCAAPKSEVLDSPETAHPERSLRRFSFVAIEQTVTSAKFVANSPIGTLHSLRIGVFKPIPGKTKQGCVQFVSIENAHISLQGFIPRTRFDLVP